jgi:hypothetical protein
VPGAQLRQPSTELAPVSEYLPGSQSEHPTKPSFSSLNLPGPQNSQAKDPGLLKPVPQESQVSVAPMLNVSDWHSSSAVLASLALWPALAVAQKAEPVGANVPSSVHGSHADSDEAPVAEYLRAREAS